MRTVTVDELIARAGDEVGVSDWLRIDQDRIDAFADATLDHQFIHVDPERAAETSFGTTVAHGYLTLSLIPHLVGEVALQPERATMAVNYGSDRVRFRTPVKVGSRIRARVTLLEVTRKGDGNQYLVKNRVTVEVEDERRPALVADVLLLYFLEPPASGA